MSTTTPVDPPPPSFVLRGTSTEITCLVFHPLDSSLLVVGAADGSITLWDIDQRRPRTTLKATHQESGTLGVTFTLDGKLISQGRDGRVCVWNGDQHNADPVSVIPTHACGFCRAVVCASATNDAGTMLAIPSSNTENVNLWDLRTRDPVATFVPSGPNPTGMCMALCDVSPYGFLVSGYENGEIRVWDVRTSKELSSLKLHDEAVLCLSMDSGDTAPCRGVTGAADAKITTFSMETNEQAALSHQTTLPLPRAGIADVAIRPDRRIFAAAGWDHRVRVYAWKKNVKPLAILSHHTASVTSVSFSADGTWLASGSRDRRVALWSLYQ